MHPEISHLCKNHGPDGAAGLDSFSHARLQPQVFDRRVTARPHCQTACRTCHDTRCAWSSVAKNCGPDSSDSTSVTLHPIGRSTDIDVDQQLLTGPRRHREHRRQYASSPKHPVIKGAAHESHVERSAYCAPHSPPATILTRRPCQDCSCCIRAGAKQNWKLIMTQAKMKCAGRTSKTKCA